MSTPQDKLRGCITIETMLSKLAKRLTFTENELHEATNFLEKNNYYRFKVYPNILFRGEKYSYTDAMNLYKFDMFLRKELFNIIGIIELSLKNSIIKYLNKMGAKVRAGNRFNALPTLEKRHNELISEMKVDGHINTYSILNRHLKNIHSTEVYYDITIYKSFEYGMKTIINFEETILKFATKSLPIQHHLKKNNKIIPTWVLFEELTLGQIDAFITAVTFKDHFVSITYDPTYKKAFSGWLKNLLELRNRVSHHVRLCGHKHTSRPTILKADKNSFSKTKSDPQYHLLYSNLYVLKKFFIYEDEFNKNEWNNFLASLHSKISKQRDVYQPERLLGLYEGWYKNLYISKDTY